MSSFSYSWESKYCCQENSIMSFLSWQDYIIIVWIFRKSCRKKHRRSMCDVFIVLFTRERIVATEPSKRYSVSSRAQSVDKLSASTICDWIWRIFVITTVWGAFCSNVLLMTYLFLALFFIWFVICCRKYLSVTFHSHLLLKFFKP